MRDSGEIQYRMREVERTVRKDPKKVIAGFAKALDFSNALVLAEIYRLLFLADMTVKWLLIILAIGISTTITVQLDFALKDLARLYSLGRSASTSGLWFHPVVIAMSCYMLERLSSNHYFPFVSELVSCGIILRVIVGVMLYLTLYCCNSYAVSPNIGDPYDTDKSKKQ